MEDFAAMDTEVLDAQFVDDTSTDDSAESTALTTQDGDNDSDTSTGIDVESTALALRPSELMAAPGKLAEATKTALDGIKATNPGIAAGLQKVIHHFDQIRREFPGGMKELRTMKERLETAEQLGGTGGMDSLKQELAGFREYDRQFMTADPAFVKTMLDAEPGAFQRLAPVIFSEFQKVNPAGYSTLIAQGTIKDMMDSRFPVQMDMLAYQLSELSRELVAANSPLATLVNRAIETFNNGPFSYFTKVDAAAKAEIKMPDEAKPQANPSQSEKHALTRELWGTDTGKALGALYREEFAKQAAGRKLTDNQKTQIAELFSTRLGKALTNTPGYEDRVNAYIAAGDRQGNLRYQTSLYKQHTERILTSLLGPGKARTAGTAPVQRPSDNGTPVAAPVNTNGFIMLGKPPLPSEIDPRTTPNMIDRNQAILRDNRKVTWK